MQAVVHNDWVRLRFIPSLCCVSVPYPKNPPPSPATQPAPQGSTPKNLNATPQANRSPEAVQAEEKVVIIPHRKGTSMYEAILPGGRV